MSQSNEFETSGDRRRHSASSADECHFLQGVHDLRRLLNGEWVWDVFISLRSGPMQYTGILTAIRARPLENDWPGRNHTYLQESTLNRTLRRLEEAELIDRLREDAFPYRTTYWLTPPAMQLLTAAMPFVEWAEEHADLLDRARQRRGGGHSGG